MALKSCQEEFQLSSDQHQRSDDLAADLGKRTDQPKIGKSRSVKLVLSDESRGSERHQWQQDICPLRAANITTNGAPRWQPSCASRTAANPSVTSTASTKIRPTTSPRGRSSVTPSALNATSVNAATASRTTSLTTPVASVKARSNKPASNEAARASCCLLSGGRGPFRVAGRVKFRPTQRAAHSRAAHTRGQHLLTSRTLWPETDG